MNIECKHSEEDTQKLAELNRKLADVESEIKSFKKEIADKTDFACGTLGIIIL